MTQAFKQSNDLPLTEVTFLIMLSISSEPRHGYAIMKEVQRMSDGRVNLSTGTLYGAIKRLLESNWIERVDETEASKAENKRSRKSYRLSIRGKRILQDELARLRTLVNLAKRQAQGANA